MLMLLIANFFVVYFVFLSIAKQAANFNILNFLQLVVVLTHFHITDSPIYTIWGSIFIILDYSIYQLKQTL